jgi:hypothetical protein
LQVFAPGRLLAAGSAACDTAARNMVRSADVRSTIPARFGYRAVVPLWFEAIAISTVLVTAVDHGDISHTGRACGRAENSASSGMRLALTRPAPSSYPPRYHAQPRNRWPDLRCRQ